MANTYDEALKKIKVLYDSGNSNLNGVNAVSSPTGKGLSGQTGSAGGFYDAPGNLGDLYKYSGTGSQASYDANFDPTYEGNGPGVYNNPDYAQYAGAYDAAGGNRADLEEDPATNGVDPNETTSDSTSGSSGSGSSSKSSSGTKSSTSGTKNSSSGSTSGSTSSGSSSNGSTSGSTSGTGYSSAYSDQIDEILKGILGYGSFDPETNEMYQQMYKNAEQKYKANAKLAMQNQMGNAAILNGGYGSSYASVAGQQAYNEQMNNLSDIQNNLMQLAYQQYQDELQNKYAQLAALQGLDSDAYTKWLNQYNSDKEQARYDQESQKEQERYDSEKKTEQERYDQESSTEQSRYDDSKNDSYLSAAITLAMQGIVPEAYKQYLDADTYAWLVQIANQNATNNSGGSSGSSSGSSGGSSGSSSGSSSGESGNTTNGNTPTAESYANYENTFKTHFTKNQIVSSQLTNYNAAVNIANAIKNGIITQEQGDAIAKKYGVNFDQAAEYESRMVGNQSL